MAKLSANTLFHFTPRVYLLDKFERGFIPRYNIEFDPVDGDFFAKHAVIHHQDANGERSVERIPPVPTLIPMVCFCDIPLSSLEFHMSVYSGYGIGLRKEWAEEKGLNPVMYINENSSFFTILSGQLIMTDFMFLSFRQQVKDELSKLSEQEKDTEGIANMLYSNRIFYTLMRDMIISHMKPRVAKGKYRGKYDNYSYYDEKEWRYVPHLGGEETPQIIHGNVSNGDLRIYNERIKGRGVDFTPDAVKYIIVESEDDISFIINGLNDIKRRTKKYTDSDISQLTSKIITRKQILEDF